MKSIALLAAVLWLGIVHAQIPRQVSYQGSLTNPGGTPVNATVSMAFNLYNVVSGGAALYTETHSVTVTDGVFNVLIGSVTPLPLPFDVPYYLGVKVGADPELAPRQPVVASAYAIRAATAEALAASATVAGSRITGAITTATLPAANLSGTIATAKGGTGQPTLTANGLLYGQGTGNVGVTSAGTIGQLLAATAGAPAWTGSPTLSGDLGVNGSVGAGVITPSARFHVSGTSWFQNDSTPLPPSAGKGITIGYANSVPAGYIYGFDYGTFAPTSLSLNSPGGNVGIGVLNPGAKLHVQVPDNFTFNAGFLVANAAGDTKFSVRNDGTVTIGGLYDLTSTTHACYYGFNTHTFALCSSAAEYVPTIDGGAGFAEAGDLVSMAPSVGNPYGDEHAPFVVAKSAAACDDNLLGFIVNPESGADGRKVNDNYLPLAIYGYFPAKVTLQNGAIRRGDPITSSSKSGYGMKSTQACKIIGYALEDADAEGAIQVFANHGESAVTEVATLRTQVKSQAAQIAAFSTRLEALEKSAAAASAPARK
ncbi:MAG: hypothetical protein ABI831_03825 [Betaproteobacteria bacterium]